MVRGVRIERARLTGGRFSEPSLPRFAPGIGSHPILFESWSLCQSGLTLGLDVEVEDIVEGFFDVFDHHPKRL